MASTCSASPSSLAMSASAPTLQPQPQTRSDLRLPTELLLDILALAAAPLPTSSPTRISAERPRTPPTKDQTSTLLSLAPVCPLFLHFARLRLLDHALVTNQAQLDGLLRFLEGDVARWRGVKRLTVRAPRRRGGEELGPVRAEQVVRLLQMCNELEEVVVEELLDGREEYADGGAFPAVQPLVDQFFSLLIFPNYFPKSTPAPPPPKHAPRPTLPKVHLPRLRHLSLRGHLPSELSPVLDSAHLPVLRSLSLDRFTYTYPLSQLAPQLLAIRGSHFAPQLDFASVKVCAYSGSLNATSYNLPPSTEVLFLPVLPRNSSAPWLVSAIAALDKLKEVHMLKLGEAGASVRGVCGERGMKLVEIDLAAEGEWGEDGGRYWERLVDGYVAA